MKRTVLGLTVIAGLLEARAARAADDPCVPAAVDPSLRSLAVELGDVEGGDPWTRTLKPTASSAFPAVSEDGATVVDLFDDSQDFVGTPVATVVFWSKRGRIASFQLSSDFAGPDHPLTSEQAREEARVVAKVNARLAATRWRAVPVAIDCAGDSSRGPSILNLGEDLRIVYDAAHDRLTSEIVTAEPGRARRPHRISHRFPSPGGRLDGGGRCGGVTGIERAYGSRALVFVVLVPRINLGGDSCNGGLSVDLAIAVRVP